MNKFAKLDHQFIWHPFTQMRDWLKHEPVVITAGRGAVLRDIHGREYLDANSSIWTNLHGHNHPKINAAIRRQLGKIAHSSALGLANEPATLAGSETGRRRPTGVVAGVTGQIGRKTNRHLVNRRLEKVFIPTTARPRSKSHSSWLTNTRAAPATSKPRSFFRSKARIMATPSARCRPVTLICFTKVIPGLLFKTDKVMSPYCYRCPFNRAKPERADARDYRKCDWECVGLVEKKFAAQKRRGSPYAAFIFEPRMQGAPGMIPQPDGWLRQVAEIARRHGTLLIADEVMTGFGRTGCSESRLQAEKGHGKPPKGGTPNACLPPTTKACSRIFCVWPRA